MNGLAAPSHSKSFTLIELLVVVAIIAVLVAMLLPALQSARAQAQAVTCQANLKQVICGAQVYFDDHRTLPPYWIYGSDGYGYRGAKFYMDRVGIWGGPEPRNLSPDTVNMSRQVKEFCWCPTGHRPPETKDPSSGWYRAERYSYGTPEHWPVQMAAIEYPASEPFFADSAAAFTDTQLVVIHRNRWPHDPRMSSYAVALRHLGRAEVAFADGHVAALDRDGVFKVKFNSVVIGGIDTAYNPYPW